MLTAFIVLITKVSEVCWKQKLPSAIYGNWIVVKILRNSFCSCCKSVNYWSLWGLLADKSSLPFSFPVGKERQKTALAPPESTTGRGNNTLNVRCALRCRWCHQQGQELLAAVCRETGKYRAIHTKILSFMSLFWAPDYFQSLNQVFLQEPGMLILIHDLVWANEGTRYVTKVYGYVIKFGCSAKNWWTLKRLLTISEMWDTNRPLFFISWCFRYLNHTLRLRIPKTLQPLPALADQDDA